MSTEKTEPISATAAYNGTGSNEELWPILASHGAVTDPSDVRDSYLATVLINWRNAACKNVADMYQEAKSRAEEAEAEVVRLIEEKAGKFVDSTTMLCNMDVRDGQIRLDIEPARELLLAWCAAVRAVLDDCQAENYAETEVRVPEPGSVSMDIQDGRHLTDSYTLTLQRRRGKTPHQLRQDAEQELADARAELARIESMTPAEFQVWRAER